MTIQMLRTWNGLEEESVYTLAPAEETRLIGLGLARDFVPGQDGVSAGSGTAIQSPVSGAVSRVNPTSWPMRTPQVSALPPTLTTGAANAATAIAGSILWSAFDSAAFAVFGGPSQRQAAFNGGWLHLGSGYTNTSAPPCTVEFELDTADATGRFEIRTRGAGTSGDCRIAVRNRALGVWEYVTAGASFTHASDGNGYLDLVTLGAAGTYQIRLEFQPSARFGGIRVGPTDAVRAPRRPIMTWAVPGDSLSEPNIAETGVMLHDGWIPRLAYLTGDDWWCAGSGGTGYCNPGSGGRVKLADRLAADVLAYKPDGVLIPMGINDTSGAYTAAQVGAEAAECIALCKFANVAEIVVVAHFWTTGVIYVSPDLLQYRDAIKAAAVAAGVKFIDLFELQKPTWLTDATTFVSKVSQATVSGNNFAYVADIPAYFKQANASFDNWMVKLGSGAKQIVRKVTNISGSAGNWKLDFTTTCGTVIPVDAPVSVSGESYLTGNGRLGAPNGSGNTDRFVGNAANTDPTHPPRPGHAHIAAVIAEQLSRLYS